MAGNKRVAMLVHPLRRPDRRSGKGSPENSIYVALKSLGHEVGVVTAENDISAVIEAIEEFKPRLVFNLLEEFRGEAIYDFHLVTWLESKGIAFSGCNPRGLVISRDKNLVMNICRGMGVKVPETVLVERDLKPKSVAGLKYPLFVKLNREHSSLGITVKNRVLNYGQLKRVVERLHRDYCSQVLIQEFVAGTDVTVSLLGNHKVQVFGPWRLDLKDGNDFATEQLKFNAGYRAKRKIESGPFEGSIGREIKLTAARVFRSLDLSGYARLDFRVTDSNRFYLVDVNANPNLARDEDFAESLAHRGFDYEQMIKKILALGISYKPTL